jgi:hypothetical protein
MKNVQVIDGAENSVFEIYAVSDEVFARLFPNGADIAFAEDHLNSDPIWNGFYSNPVDKKSVSGIQGTLHLRKRKELSQFFPTRREADLQ